VKFEIEPQDIEAIAHRVSELLKPLVSCIEKPDDKDTIFDVKGLAEYLHVDLSWVYKQVSLKAVPFFKTGRYTRFKKKDIDRWIESQTLRPIPTLRIVKTKGETR
jgi:excisionase family DNA binding protein